MFQKTGAIHAKQKSILIMGVALLLVGAAAFIAGRMLNTKVNPLGLFGLRGSGNVINVIAAGPSRYQARSDGCGY